jgi:hypothetical protein|tara:strand:- start:3735 stop:4517 length:783 start_codon:yes stop_codon:yes gene_type:complete
MPEKKIKSFHERRGLAQFDINKVVVEQSGVNPFFNSRYSTLDNLHKAVQTPLEKHGIYYTFKMCSMSESGRNILKLQVWDMLGKDNDSQEFEESCFALPDESDMQKLGSCMTFASRYLLIGAFCLKPDFDDDGNLASGKTESKPETSNPPQQEFQKNVNTSEDMWFEDKYMNKYQELCTEYKITKEQLLQRLKDRYKVFDPKTKQNKPVEKLEEAKFIKKENKEKLKADIMTGFMDVSQMVEEVNLTDEVGDKDLDDIPF